jgi:uncharacterized protein
MRCLLWVAAAALVAGCAASPSPRLFLLAPTPSRAPATADFAGTVALKKVDIPSYLDRPQLVRLSDPYELQLSELDRWGEGTHEMVTRVLASNLGQRLPASQVFVADSGALSVPAQIIIEVDINRFDAEPSGFVVLVGQWVVRHGELLRGIDAATVRVEGASAAPSDLVAAMSEALGGFADRIAASIGKPPMPKAAAARSR